MESFYGCPIKPTSSNGLSTGSILLIILLVIVVVYLIGGILINWKFRHLHGVEIIPNYSFWSELPGLTKDGIIFSFKKLRRLCSNSNSYNQI